MGMIHATWRVCQGCPPCFLLACSWKRCCNFQTKEQGLRIHDALDEQSFLHLFVSSAVGGMDKKRVHYVEGGQCGNREVKINNLIRSMN